MRSIHVDVVGHYGTGIQEEQSDSGKDKRPREKSSAGERSEKEMNVANW